jgi:hypothetical protein
MGFFSPSLPCTCFSFVVPPCTRGCLTNAHASLEENPQVMEAMKMEHVIRAAMDGEVDRVLFKEGDFVLGNKTLVRVFSRVFRCFTFPMYWSECHDHQRANEFLHTVLVMHMFSSLVSCTRLLTQGPPCTHEPPQVTFKASLAPPPAAKPATAAKKQ